MTLPFTLHRHDPAADPRPLSAIWLRASLEAHGFLGSRVLHDQQALIETQYLPMAETWVAADAGGPLGFVSLLGPFIGGLFVDPPAQGRGIGRALLDQARRLRDRLELEVYEENPRALRFYRNAGFIEAGRREQDDSGLPHASLRLVLPG